MKTTQVQKAWKKLLQMRLGGEFWACDVIKHKAYWVLWTKIKVNTQANLKGHREYIEPIKTQS